jgi:hypothetical protein
MPLVVLMVFFTLQRFHTVATSASAGTESRASNGLSE